MNDRSTGSQAFFLTIFVIVLLFLNAGSVSAQASLFDRTLSVGMSGSDVLRLQQILNSDPDTEIAASGTGSPGQETPYFGALTKDAVIRFQEKYGADILVPNGLSSGTGVVGASTRAVLSRIGSGANPASPAASSPSPVVSKQNPNLNGLPRFISAVEKVSTEKGVPPQQVALIEKQIYHDIATTTDLRATFLKTIQTPKVSVVIPSPVGRMMKAMSASIANLFSVGRASADTGAPLILSQPYSVSTVPGNGVVFNVSAVGNPPLRYQWMKDSANLNNGGNISGATSTGLIITNAQPTDAGSYSVLVSDNAGTTTSQTATLTISGSSNGSGGDSGGSDSGSSGSTGALIGSAAGAGASVGLTAALSSSNSSNSGSNSNSSSNGQSPFGGELYYSFYCSCSGNWLLTIQPLAPNYVTLLTYEEGTQLYLSYNLPFAQYLLGFYESGAQCQVYAGTACVTIASEGEVTSTVGSSQE